RAAIPAAPQAMPPSCAWRCSPSRPGSTGGKPAAPPASPPLHQAIRMIRITKGTAKVTASVRRAGFTVLCLILVIGMAPKASAFFPLGGFDTFNPLRLATWGLTDFDNNNDGDIREDVGLRPLLEDGPSGFTDEELLIVRRSLDTWANVPTSYVAFQV